MKKIYIPLILCLCFVTLLSCSNSKKSVSSNMNSLKSHIVEESNVSISQTSDGTNSDTNRKVPVISASDSSNSKVIEKGKNHKIIDSSTADKREFHYWIFNNKGDVMHEELSGKEPSISYLSNNIVQLDTGGGNVTQCQYFDTDKNLISPIYENPSLLENRKIVYMKLENDKIKLVVSDLFDKSKFYREYKRDFSPVATPYSALINAKFIDSSRLQITYLSGSDHKEVAEIIDLN